MTFCQFCVDVKSVEGEPHEKAVELLKAAQGLSTLIHTHVALLYV